MKTKKEIQEELQEIKDCQKAILELKTIDKAKTVVIQRLQMKINALEWVLEA